MSAVRERDVSSVRVPSIITMTFKLPVFPPFQPHLVLAVSLMVAGVKAELPLQIPEDLSGPRRELISKALDLYGKHPRVPYLEGGADVDGMDCSGAVTVLLKQVGIEPPRTAHDQYEWVKRSGRLTVVADGVRSAADPVFQFLLPGDLVFWARETPGRADRFRVSHVHMYLGKQPDGHPVMIGSSDGRSYRGKKVRGFGIVDFRVPKPGSATRIIGFGSPLPAIATTSPNPGNAGSSGD